MAKKKLNELDPATITLTRLIGHGNPSTGKMNRATVSDLIGLINEGQSPIKPYGDIQEMLANDDLPINYLAFVNDAGGDYGDPEITSGWGLYMYVGPSGDELGNYTLLASEEGDGSGIQSIVAGTNVSVDDTDPLNPIVSASGGGGGTVESVTGDGVDNTDPDNPVISFPDAVDVTFTPAGDLSATTVQAALEELDSEKVSSADIANKVDKETFASLTFASPIAWNTDNRQSPLGKVTMTGSAAINMTNVKDGSQGVLKITSGTASQFTLTFDTDFTNVEATTGQTMLTYTFPDVNGAVYLLSYVVDGTTISWVILDTEAAVVNPMARVTRVTAQSISNNDLTVAVTFTAETYDNNAIWASTPNPTRLVIPGSGDKVAHISIRSQWASNATGLRRNIPYLNGVSTSDIGQQVPASGVATILNTSHQVICAGGDYIEIVCYQNSGGSLNLDVCVVQITVFDI